MPRLAAGGAAEGGFARGGRLEDAALRIRTRVVGRGFALRPAVGAIGQGLGTVHFVEVGFVNFRGATTRGPPTPTLPRKGGGRRGPAALAAPLTPTLSPRRAGRGGRGAGRWGDAQPG